MTRPDTGNRDGRRHVDASAQRYRQAKAIAQRVLEHAGEDREAVLDQACDGDEHLRAEARWLIDAAEDASADRLPPHR